MLMTSALLHGFEEEMIEIITETPYDYEDPYTNNGCNSNEYKMHSIQDVPGGYCAPKCNISADHPCSYNLPPNVTATQQCMFIDVQVANNKYANLCGLSCKLYTGSNQCGSATCYQQTYARNGTVCYY